LGIAISGRHRAAGDALATVQLFELLLKKNNGIILPDDPYQQFSADSLHPQLTIEFLKQLPESTGVYYLHDEKGDVIYIGKSKNIRKRVLTHLGNPKTKKGIELKQKTADVSFELTGSELLALLKESDEIKQVKPLYNRAQRKKRNQIGLYQYHDRKGYARLMLKRNEGIEAPLASFQNMEEARMMLFHWIEEFDLCQQLCGLYESKHGCFQYQLKQCKGACNGEESAASYNLRVDKLMSKLAFGFVNAVIIEKGRHPNECSLVVIENGTYLGFGWLERQESISAPEEFKGHIKMKDDNRDVRIIISGYLKRNKPERIISY
jgi:DNA polymerase-3 subunit epsilon